MNRPSSNQAGFTLIEAMVAMAIFAIGALMMVPSMVAWVEANTVSMQRDEAMRILEAHSAELDRMGTGQDPWTNSSGNFDNYAAARSSLDGMAPSSLTDIGTAPAFSTPVHRPGLSMTASVSYAVVGITDKGGNVLSRIMRLRTAWTGPGGNQLAEERLLQRKAE